MTGRRKAHIIIFALYSALMVYLLFHREPPADILPYSQLLQLRINWQPLRTIRHFWKLLSHANAGFARLAVINLVGNVVMFIPLGYFLPLVFPKLQAWWKTLLVSAGIVCIIELAQLFTLLGTCDIDDLILNLPAAVLGWLLFRLTAGRNIQE